MTDTWRTFDTVDEAQAYALDCWLAIVKQAHADRTDAGTKLVTKFVDVAKLDAAQVDTLAVDGIPLYGFDDKGNVVTDRGVTLRWDIPRETLKGQWAVQCPPGVDGDPEPEWPTPPPLGGGKVDATVDVAVEAMPAVKVKP